MKNNSLESSFTLITNSAKSGTHKPRIHGPEPLCRRAVSSRVVRPLHFFAKEGKAMKWPIAVAVIAVLCLSLFCSLPDQNNQAQAQAKKAPAQQKITVLSPIGQPPEIQLKPMAPRLDTLEGKTIYLVNDGYLGTDILLKEMEDWFRANMPKVTIVYRAKGGGGFTAEDPKLWAEIKEKANGVVMGMGH
jgi:hypothetical protein